MEIIKKLLRKALTLAIIAAIGFGGYFAYNKYLYKYLGPYVDKMLGKQTEVAAVNLPTQVTTSEIVSLKDLKEVVTATGIVSLKSEQSVFATTEAKVKDVFVDVGDTVTAGQQVVTYDVETTKTDLEKKIKDSEISLQNQLLSLKSMTLLPTEAEIDNLKNNILTSEKSLYDANATLTGTLAKISQQETEIEAAQKNIDTQEQQIKTNDILLNVGAITKEEYEKSVTQKETYIKQYDSAVNTLNDLLRTKESNEKNIETAERSLANAEKKLEDSGSVLSTEADQIKYEQQQNQVRLSELNLENMKTQLNSIIYSDNSPINGTVTTVSVEKASAVTNGKVLVKVADFSQLIVKCNISEYDSPNVKLGQSVSMTSDGIPDVIYKGTVTKISASATTQNAVSGSETVVPIEISVDNVDSLIKPGFSLNVEILVVDKPQVLSVNVSAIKKDAQTGESYVFVLTEDRMLKRTVVELGIQGDLSIEALSGLKEGDTVITNPTDRMRDGMPLEMPSEEQLQQMRSQMRQGGGTNGQFNNQNAGFRQGVPAGNIGGGGAAIRMPGN